MFTFKIVLKYTVAVNFHALGIKHFSPLACVDSHLTAVKFAFDFFIVSFQAMQIGGRVNSMEDLDCFLLTS